jgi:hypothetical protein
MVWQNYILKLRKSLDESNKYEEQARLEKKNDTRNTLKTNDDLVRTSALLDFRGKIFYTE